MGFGAVGAECLLGDLDRDYNRDRPPVKCVCALGFSSFTLSFQESSAAKIPVFIEGAEGVLSIFAGMAIS